MRILVGACHFHGSTSFVHAWYLVVCVHTHQTRTVYARNPHKPIYALGHDEWRLGDLGFAAGAKFRSRELKRESMCVCERERELDFMEKRWLIDNQNIIIIAYKTLVIIDIE